MNTEDVTLAGIAVGMITGYTVSIEPADYDEVAVDPETRRIVVPAHVSTEFALLNLIGAVGVLQQGLGFVAAVHHGGVR
jgi:hypothetical protein